MHMLGVVEPQGIDCGTTDGGKADDVRLVLAENEVFLPGLRARVKREGRSLPFQNP